MPWLKIVRKVHRRTRPPERRSFLLKSRLNGALEIPPSCIDATSRSGRGARFVRALLFRCDTKTVHSMPVCKVIDERRRSQSPAQNILTIPTSNGQSSSRPEVVFAQHGHARAVALLERAVVVDPHALEVRHARGREQRERFVAEFAVVALEQDQAHGAGGRQAGA